MESPSSPTSTWSGDHGTSESRGSSAVTHGVRVDVEPSFLEGHSNPYENQFIFQYQICITNESDETVTLRTRHWIIIDEHGDREDVEGEGVIGMQPTLKPGESFEYESYCPLETRWGTMEGVYHFESEGGEMFDVPIARFYLVAPESATRSRTPAQ